MVIWNFLLDPEYQQIGIIGVKSDVYSFGILLLQVITAKSPMGLTHIVEQAIENETLKEILDSDVPDWPIEEALCFAKLALQCAELRRKDMPDLGTEVLPELNRLRDLAEEKMNYLFFAKGFGPSPNHSLASITPPISQISITPTNLSQTSATPTNLSQVSITQVSIETIPLRMNSLKLSGKTPKEWERKGTVTAIVWRERAVEEKQSPQSGKEGSKKGSSSIDHDGASSSASAGKNGSEEEYALQGQFGHKKFVPADPPDMLIYEGCELLLISASDAMEEELGMELKTECEGDDDRSSFLF
ncbi:hypothetical protein NC651_031124 [Populus alba x Populus x berolinensis]|nr:hypothetical protein NC651_031124 [Populus alba x Populus x berolinensis]